MFERIAEPSTLAAVLRIHKDRSATATSTVANVGMNASEDGSQGESTEEAARRPARVVSSASALLRTCLLRANSTDELLNGFHHVMLGAAAKGGGGGGDGDGGKRRKEKKRPRVGGGGAAASGDDAQTRMYQDKLFKTLHTLTTTTTDDDTDGDTDGGDVGVPQSVELGLYSLPLLLTLFGEASFQAAARRVAQEAHNPTVFVAGQKW